MEIMFNKFSYYENRNSSKIVYLDEVSLSINEGEIVFFVSENFKVLNDLLTIKKRPSKGEIHLDNLVVKRTSHIEKNDIIKKIGYIPSDMLFEQDIVKDEILWTMKKYGYKTKDAKKHVVDSLKIAGLDEKFFNRKIETLSFTEKKKVMFAKTMSYNPDVLIVEDFSKGLIFREKEYFRKLFLKLKNKFNKTIIIVGTDLSFAFDNVDKVFVINNGKLVLSGNKGIFYDNELYKYVEVPKIVEFTKYANELGHDILEYTDFKELIKELYRKVK